MQNPKLSTLSAVAGLLAVLMSGAATTALAQAPTPPPDKMPQHMEGMHGMMGAPHHVLAMAYHANLATFAKALQEHAAHSKTVDLELVRPVLAEMRRSLDQMQQHHQAQIAMTADSTKAPMRHMEAHLTTLGKHLTALDSEASAGTPDMKKLLDTTAEILKLCADMSGMPGMAKPHPMQ